MSVRSRSRCALAKVREALQDLLPLSPLGINTAARRLRLRLCLRLRRRHVDRRWSVDYWLCYTSFKTCRSLNAVQLKWTFPIDVTTYIHIYWQVYLYTYAKLKYALWCQTNKKKAAQQKHAYKRI